MCDATAPLVTEFELPGQYFELGCLSGGARFVGVGSGCQLQKTATNCALYQPDHVVTNGLCAGFRIDSYSGINHLSEESEMGCRLLGRVLPVGGGGGSGNYRWQEEGGGFWVGDRSGVGRRVSGLVSKGAHGETSSNPSWGGVGRWLCPWC